MSFIKVINRSSFHPLLLLPTSHLTSPISLLPHPHTPPPPPLPPPHYSSIFFISHSFRKRFLRITDVTANGPRLGSVDRRSALLLQSRKSWLNESKVPGGPERGPQTRGKQIDSASVNALRPLYDSNYEQS